MSFLSKVVSIAALLLFSCSVALAQTVISSFPATISTSGSYYISTNVPGSSITITADNVTLDLHGFTVKSPNSTITCSVTASTRGNNCSGGPFGTIPLVITGQNVVVKNGIISSGETTGISVSGTAARQDVTLQDLIVKNFWSDCIYQNSSSGLRLINVTTTACGGSGINVNDDVTFQNVVSSNNNGNGISVGRNSVMENVITGWNKGSGIVALAGTINHANSYENGLTGVSFGGIIRDVLSQDNVGDGIANPGAGLVINSSSIGNSGNGFTLSSNVCYAGLSNYGNTGTAISGGVALAGATSHCP